MAIASPKVFQTILCLQVGFHIAGFEWYFRRRNKFPIPVRKPWLVLTELVLGGLVGSSWLIWDAIPGLSNLSCGVVFTLQVYAFVALLTCMVVRASLLWLWDILTRLSIKYQAALEGKQLTLLNPDEFKVRWLPEELQIFMVRHRHWVTWQSAVSITIVCWLFITGCYVYLVNMYANDSFFQVSYVSDVCIAIQAKILAFGVSLVLTPCLVINAFVGISGNDDNFGLFNEMRGMLAAGYLLCAILAIAQIPQFFVFFFEEKQLHTMLGFGADLLLLWISTYRIILWTYLINRKKFLFANVNYWWKEIKAPEDIRMETLMSKRLEETTENLTIDVALLFKQLLSKPNGKMLFEKFLAMEYSLENMLFYNASVHYQSLFEAENRISKEEIVNKVIFTANAIKDKFISDKSLTSVNISAKTRKDVLKNLESILQHLRLVQGELIGSSQLQQVFNINNYTRVSDSQSVGSVNEVDYVKMQDMSHPSSVSEKRFQTTQSNEEFRVHDLRQELNQILVEFQGLFTEAQEEVYNLMQKDSFSRFMKTSQYQQFIRYEEFASDITVRATMEANEDDLPKKSKSRFDWKRIVLLISCLPTHLSYLADERH
jgi:hypothetical protein